MVTKKELDDAITELGAAAMKLSNIIKELGNEDLIVAYRENAVRGFYNFTTECGLIDGYLKLEDVP